MRRRGDLPATHRISVTLTEDEQRPHHRQQLINTTEQYGLGIELSDRRVTVTGPAEVIEDWHELGLLWWAEIEDIRQTC